MSCCNCNFDLRGSVVVVAIGCHTEGDIVLKRLQRNEAIYVSKVDKY